MLHNDMFVAAGIQTCLSYFVKHIPSDKLDKFIKIVAPKGLVSFGATLNKQNKDKFNKDKHINSILGELKFYPVVKNNMDLYLDSGGYQVTTGLVPKKNIEKFCDAYIEFLNTYTDMYTVAFSLDIPVLPDITSRDEMLQLNLESYNIIDSLHSSIKDRLIFVSHFRLKELLDIWNSLIFEHQIIDKYKKFSIGGLVASQPAAKKLFFDLYSIGILQILKGLEKLPNPFYLHILGSATSTNIIYFSLLEKHIQNLTGVDCIITFDSSAVFTKVQMGRTFTYFDKEEIACFTVDLRSKNLDLRMKNNKTPRQMVYEITSDICSYCNLEVPDPSKIYDPNTDTFSEDYRPFILALESYTLNQISRYMRKHSEYLYDLYKHDDPKFIFELEKLFINFNNKKFSDISKQKVSSIKHSLDTIQKYYHEPIDSFLKFCKNISYVLDSEQTNDFSEHFDFLKGVWQMEFLRKALSILCNQCSSPSVKRKQKLLAKTIRSLISLIDIPGSYSELKECLLTICDLHNKYPEEPGNIIISSIFLEKYTDLKDYIQQSQQVILEEEQIDSFLQFISDKIKAQEISQRVDTIIQNLLDLKNIDNDNELVSRYEKLVHKEYISVLKRQNTDENTEIELSGDISEDRLRELFSEISFISKQRTRLPSGIKSLDSYLKPGFEATRIYVFGGRPGLGKSALILNFFLNATKTHSNKKSIVVYITLENDIIETTERIVRITTKQPISIADISDSELEYIIDSFKNSYRDKLRIKYMNPYSTSTMDIFLYIDKLSEEFKIKGIFVDYLNLVSSAEKIKKMEKRFELGMVTAELKVIAKRFQCPVITPAQLNTAGYEGIPTMKNLDESRQIAQNADFVGLMFQYPLDKIPPQLLYTYPEEKFSITGINIDKNRNGPSGMVFLLGQKDIYLFSSLDPQTEKNLKYKLLYSQNSNSNNFNNGYKSNPSPQPQTFVQPQQNKILNTPFIWRR